MCSTSTSSLHRGFRYADADSLILSRPGGADTCAVMLELIQGEGGVLPLDKGFIQELAAYCRAKTTICCW